MPKNALVYTCYIFWKQVLDAKVTQGDRLSCLDVKANMKD